MVSLEPRLLKRYARIAGLLFRHGGDDWLRPDARRELAQQGVAETAHDDSADLADDLEALGPTFIKLGQLLSTRPDIVPPRYIQALRRLCDKVQPFPADEARAIVEDELGARITRLFDSFDEKPFAAASLSQVHRARLRDGREVAVKIRRPDIAREIDDDLDALQEIANFLERHYHAARCMRLGKVVREFRRSLLLELDFNNERANLERFSTMLEGYPSLVLPAPVKNYCGARVLTMDFLEGTNITALSPVVRTELDGARLAREFFDAYMHQVLVEGIFHADPHPGNLLLTPERRLGILDLGMVGRLRNDEQRGLLKLLLAVADNNGTQAARIASDMGEASEAFDRASFERRIDDLVTRHDHAEIAELNVGRIVIDICRIATENGLLLPPGLALLGKTLMQLDEVGRTLDPSFDPHAAIRANAARIMQRRMDQENLPGQLYTTLLEARDFAEKAPGQLSRVLEHLAENEVRIKVDAFDQQALTGSIRKIANRITAGIVLAALIIGAALLMRVSTPFTLFGYPGLAILLFLAATSGGFWLAISILAGDRRREPHQTG